MKTKEEEKIKECFNCQGPLKESGNKYNNGTAEFICTNCNITQP